MNTQDVLDPKSWAEQTFGSVHLHDRRRTRRAVKASTKLAENPLGSLPAHMHTWKETKALYRWLEEPDVTFAALMQPHVQQTGNKPRLPPWCCWCKRRGDIDLSHRRTISGVGHFGNERGRGCFVQTVLAIGTPEPGSMWVHVGDPRADMFPFFQACRSTQTHFLVRAAQNRRVQESEEEIAYELPQARSWPRQASRVLELPARHSHQKRDAQLQLS